MVTQVHTQAIFYLGDIEVSAAHNSLRLGETTLKLQPKAMEVLHYLATHQDRVISAQELMDQLWPGRVVTQGSVQKSINAIRNALTQLRPDEEIIGFFSKRGYQLQVPVKLSSDLAQTLLPPSDPTQQLTNGAKFSKQQYLVILMLCIAVLSGLLWYKHRPITKHHNIHFTLEHALTQLAGHERTPSPHPDNIHLAYVTENFIVDNSQTESRLLIRNNHGHDWQLAVTDGSWFKLAWSPSGKHLAAIEVKRADNKLLYANFYEKSNFIYTFHLFTLDLDRQTLLEKQTLSQWQGRIFSLSWWDDNTLEIVAKQGQNGSNVRYRYAMTNQKLTQLDEIDGAENPNASSVLNQMTALASQHGKQTQIDFLDAHQKILGRYKLAYSHLDISWIPDGSGILAFSEESQKLLLLYRDGEIINIPLQVKKDRLWSKARFSSTGDKIYVTQELRRSNIQKIKLNGQQSDITQNDNFNFEASYSPDGKTIIYATAQNSDLLLYLVKDGVTTLLTQNPITERLGKFLWDSDGTGFFFNAGSQLYHFNIEDKKLILIRHFEGKTEALGYDETTKKMIISKTLADIKNLWEYDLQTQIERQITYGNVAGAVADNKAIYLQYLNEAGLWKISEPNSVPQNIAPEFPINSRLLAINLKSLFFITGGTCKESDIQQLDLQSKIISTMLMRKNHQTNTLSFHPEHGLLQTRCYIPESKIVELY